MLELQNGHIVCLNSVLALSAIPGAIDYCTSKASAFAFMESLTLGLLDCPGVSATTVLPFHTSTEMFQGMRVRSVCKGPASSELSPTSRSSPGQAYYAQRKQKQRKDPEPFIFGKTVGCCGGLGSCCSGQGTFTKHQHSGKLPAVKQEQSADTQATRCISKASCWAREPSDKARPSV